jgi:hypothetical protein
MHELEMHLSEPRLARLSSNKKRIIFVPIFDLLNECNISPVIFIWKLSHVATNSMT